MNTTFNLNQLVRPNILSLKPYRSARDDFKEGILLDANENPFETHLNEHLQELNRYPDPHFEALREAIAHYRSVLPEQIFLGNGSDEAIDLLIRMCCIPGKDRILITPPTYGMYQVSADIHGIETIKIPLKPDFSLETKAIIEKRDEASIIFLCSPNNPTANLLEQGDILRIMDGYHGIVVVDEAYMDFSPGDSLLPFLGKYPNLVILQTLSKAFGLAGIRLGMAFGSPEIIRILMAIKPPYNINSITQWRALQAFKEPEIIQQNIKTILQNRSKLIEDLSSLPMVKKIHSSAANFLLVQFDDALSYYKKLAAQGIIVRYRGDQLHCENCLRITVGTAIENQKLTDTLRILS